MLVAIMACVRLVGRCSLSYLLLYYQLSCAMNVIIRLDMHILLENALLLSYVVSRLTIFTNGPNGIWHSNNARKHVSHWIRPTTAHNQFIELDH